MSEDKSDNGSTKRTLRERKFIDVYLSTNGNASKAYLAISPDVTKDSAKELGSRMLKKVGLSIVEILDKEGLTDPFLSKKLMEGVTAKRTIGRGASKKEELDHTAITKYLEMIFRLKTLYPADRSKFELTGPGGEPLARTVVLKEIIYQDCPLKAQCPIKEKVKQAENSRKEKDRKNEK